MPQAIPEPILKAYEDRVTLTAKETARLLAMDVKTLVEHVKAGNIGYVAKGLGGSRIHREFTLSDVVGFLEHMRQRECPSTSPKTQRTTTTISNGEVIGFTARLAKQSAERLRRSNGPSRPR